MLVARFSYKEFNKKGSGVGASVGLFSDDKHADKSNTEECN